MSKSRNNLSLGFDIIYKNYFALLKLDLNFSCKTHRPTENRQSKNLIEPHQEDIH